MRTFITHGFALGLFVMLFAACEQRVDDALLTANVKTEMTADGRISPTRVNVDTLNGVVTLKGEVPTQQEKDAAEQVARRIAGVRSVNNQIVVNPAAAGTGVPSGNEIKEGVKETAGNITQEVKKETGEAVLVGKIKTRLIAAGFTNVAVEVIQGEVTLKGEVASEKDRTAVVAIVEKVEGVGKINNQLMVKGQ
jgi:osmotically-inducible protein OsmY